MEEYSYRSMSPEFDKHNDMLDKALFDNTSTVCTASDGDSTLSTFEEIRAWSQINRGTDQARDGPDSDECTSSDVQALFGRARDQVAEYADGFFSEEQQQARAEMFSKTLNAVRRGAVACNPESVDSLLIRLFDQPLGVVEVHPEMHVADSLTVNETLTDEFTVESEGTRLNRTDTESLQAAQSKKAKSTELLQAAQSKKAKNNALFLVPMDPSKALANTKEFTQGTVNLSSDSVDDESITRFQESLYKRFEEQEKLKNATASIQDIPVASIQDAGSESLEELAQEMNNLPGNLEDNDESVQKAEIKRQFTDSFECAQKTEIKRKFTDSFEQTMKFGGNDIEDDSPDHILSRLRSDSECMPHTEDDTPERSWSSSLQNSDIQDTDPRNNFDAVVDEPTFGGDSSFTEIPERSCSPILQDGDLQDTDPRNNFDVVDDDSIFGEDSSFTDKPEKSWSPSLQDSYIQDTDPRNNFGAVVDDSTSGGNSSAFTPRKDNLSGGLENNIIDLSVCEDTMDENDEEPSISNNPRSCQVDLFATRGLELIDPYASLRGDLEPGLRRGLEHNRCEFHEMDNIRALEEKRSDVNEVEYFDLTGEPSYEEDSEHIEFVEDPNYVPLAEHIDKSTLIEPIDLTMYEDGNCY